MSFPGQALRHHAFVDIETTGLDPVVDEIIELGVVFVEAGEVVDRAQWLVRPSRGVPPLIAALTGLDDAALAGARRWHEIRPEAAARLAGWTVVAHNASFEQSFLGEVIAAGPCVDSCELLNLLFPELPSHSLDALVRWAGLSEGARHRAVEDAEDTLRVLEVAWERAGARGGRRTMEAVVRRLGPPGSVDEEALEALLLATPAPGLAPAPLGPEVPSPRPADGSIAAWVERAGPLVVESERAEAVADLAAAAAARGVELVVATSLARSPAPPAGARLVLGPGERGCRSVARAVLEGLELDERAARQAAAYLLAWSAHSPALVLERVSGWARHVWPAMDWLAPLLVAGTLPCADSGCPCRDDRDGGPIVVTSHATALDWLVRAPAGGRRFVFLDAHRLGAAWSDRATARLSGEAVGRARRQLGAVAGEVSVARGDETFAESTRRVAAGDDRLRSWLAQQRPGSHLAGAAEVRALRGLLRELSKDVSAAAAALGTAAAQGAVRGSLLRLLARLADVEATVCADRRWSVERKNGAGTLVVTRPGEVDAAASLALASPQVVLAGPAPAVGSHGWATALGLGAADVVREPVRAPGFPVAYLPRGSVEELAEFLAGTAARLTGALHVVVARSEPDSALALALTRARPASLSLRAKLGRARGEGTRFELGRPVAGLMPSATGVAFVGRFANGELAHRLGGLPPSVTQVWVPSGSEVGATREPQSEVAGGAAGGPAHAPSAHR